jgi:hypothetical protein
VLQRNRTGRSVDGGDALLAGRQNASDVGDPDGVTGVQALVGGWVDEPNEREAIFPRIVALAPGFGDYQSKTRRVIPLFELLRST